MRDLAPVTQNIEFAALDVRDADEVGRLVRYAAGAPNRALPWRSRLAGEEERARAGGGSPA